MKRIGHIHSYLPATMAGLLLLFLLLSSFAILYATIQNINSVQKLAEKSLESTALSLAYSAESSLRSSGKKAYEEIGETFSDRVVAYALVAARDGKILFHTNPRLVGTVLRERDIGQRLQSAMPAGTRVVLQTGVSAYEYNYVVHRTDGTAELLRLVLNTTPVDYIVGRARRMWWIAGGILVFIWTMGILFGRIFIRNIGLQKELEQKKRMAIIGQMTAVLAHEIRNALGSMKGYTQLVYEKIPDADSRRAELAIALQGSERIESLVNNLLLFSREEMYRMDSLDLKRMVDETLLSLVPPWEGKIVVDLPAGLYVRADKEKLQGVLLNGVRNALQAMGDAGELHISAGSKSHWVTLYIIDTGCGIPGPDIPRLFTPFHTTKTDGVGLGLSYSRKVMEGMGGYIGLKNREDGPGAVLSIRLAKAEGTR
jgi:two-component system sensor histidine kinase HydH